MMYLRYGMLIALSVSLLLADASLYAQELVPRSLRLAIVSSQEIQDRGISDLLTALLTQTNGIELVEREQLRLALDQMELSTLSDARASEERIALGRILAADVILILELINTDQFTLEDIQKNQESNRETKFTVHKKQVVRLLICDCRTGARVSVFSMELEDQEPAIVAHKLNRHFNSCINRLVQGIRYVVGISPFLSNELEHDYDSYQESLARLVESAFLSMPGVAVVERNKAEVIWNELVKQDDSTLHRAVPLLVEGEFSVESKASDRPIFSIQMTGRFAKGHTVRLASKAVPYDELSSQINTLIEKIIEKHPAWSSSKLERNTQLEWLKERSRMFSGMGAWKSAIGLQQAALLLDPRDIELRLRLISNQRMLLRHMATTEYETSNWPGAIGSLDRAEKLIAIYLDQLRNEEYLIRNRLVDLHLARRILSQWGYPSQQSGVRKSEAIQQPAIRSLLADAEQKRKTYLSSISKHLFDLSENPAQQYHGSLEGRLGDLQEALLSQFVKRIDYQQLTISDIQSLRRLWEENIPDSLGFPGVLQQITNGINSEVSNINKKHRFALRDYHNKDISALQWTKYLEELSLVSHQTIRLSARVQLLKWRWYFYDKNSTPEEHAYLRDMADSVAIELENYSKKDNIGRSFFTGGGGFPLKTVHELRWKLFRYSVMPDPFASRRQVKVALAKQRPRQKKSKQQESKISFLPLEFRVPALERKHRLSQSINPAIRKSFQYRYGTSRQQSRWRWTPCSDRFDIVWWPGAMYVMRQSGKLDEVSFPSEHDVILHDVRWDGELLWVATLASGVFVYDDQMKLKYHLTKEEGLLPSEHALKILPLGNRRAAVVGSFGPQYRAWCASIDLKPTQPKIEVFHEAKKVPESRATNLTNQSGSKDDTQRVFVPHLLTRIKMAALESGIKRDVLCIGRMQGNSTQAIRPLFVDLNQSVFTDPQLANYHLNFSSRSLHEDDFIAHRGRLYHKTQIDKIVKTSSQGKHTYYWVQGVNRSQGFLKLGDTLHLPTPYRWLEFDLHSGIVRDLANDDRAYKSLASSCLFAKSANYGVVAWDNSRRVYQVNINQTKDHDDPKRKDRSKTSQVTPISKNDMEPQILPSEQQLEAIRDRIRSLLRAGHILPQGSKLYYADGHAWFDGWLPHISLRSLYLDPPLKKTGCILHVHNGRVARLDSLKEQHPIFKVWFDSQGAPILSVQTATNRQTGKVEDHTIRWGVYGDNKLLHKVLHFDQDLILNSLTVKENGQGYKYTITRSYSSNGKSRSTAREEYALDANGERVQPGEERDVAYSPRLQSILEPTRIGLKPYYPIPESVD